MDLRRKIMMFTFPLLGALGAVLRLVQLRFGFDAETGLALHGNFTGIFPLLCGAAILILAPVTLYVIPPKRGGTLSELYGDPSPSLWLIAAALTALMGILNLIPFPTGAHPLLAIAALVSTPYLAVMSHSKGTLRTVCLTEHTFFYTLWLTLFFSAHSSDPVRMAFWPSLIALCFSALSLCVLTCSAGGFSRPAMGRCTLLAGTAFCLIAAVDDMTALPGFLAAALIQFDMAWES